MSAKRFLITALAAMCAVSLLIPAAYAHGCHGRSARPAAHPCSVEDCTASGWHYHDRTLYCGHTHGQDLCSGSCVPLCSVDGCAATGLHSHQGVVCCGYDHEEGFCDGTCPVYRVSSRSHHGGCHGGRR